MYKHSYFFSNNNGRGEIKNGLKNNEKKKIGR